jgi:hypothetical protein
MLHMGKLYTSKSKPVEKFLDRLFIGFMNDAAYTKALHVLKEKLTDTTFHLKLNQTIHLNRIFHRQFTSEWFDEPHDDHLCCFSFSQATAH